LRQGYPWQRKAINLAILAAVTGCSVAVILISTVSAYAITCVQSSQWTTSNNSRRYDFKVNTASFAAIIPSVGGDNAKYAAIAAGSTWNEQANAATYRYIGTTSATTADCNAKYSVVGARSENSDTSASILAMCPDPITGEYTQFKMNIWANDPDGNPRVFGVGDIAAGTLDLVSLMTHELGHSAGLSHPSDGTIAIMSGYGYSGTRNFRDLYTWDVECSRLSGGDRARSVKYRTVTNGVIGSEMSMIASGHTHASASRTIVGGVGQHNWTGKQQGNSVWADRIANPTITSLAANVNVGTGAMAALWRENPSYDRAFWITHYEYDSSSNIVWDGTGSHRILVQFTNNKFASSSTYKLRHCTSMPTFMTCGAVSYVNSSLPLSISHDLMISKTVVAWVNHDRDMEVGDYPNHELLVTHGTVNNYTLPTPNDLYEKSAVSPGLACHINSVYGGYDCILAWVDWDDPLYKVQVTSFKTTGTASNHYSMTKGTTYSLGDDYITRRTSSRIAAWRHDFKWGIAIRTAYYPQECYIYNSSDASANSWSYVGSIGPCDEGPSAISYEYADNMLVYIE